MGSRILKLEEWLSRLLPITASFYFPSFLEAQLLFSHLFANRHVSAISVLVGVQCHSLCLHYLSSKSSVILFLVFTVGQNNEESRLKYWATRSSLHSFARTTHSIACSTLLALLARSAALTRSLAHSLCSLPVLDHSGIPFSCPTPITDLRSNIESFNFVFLLRHLCMHASQRERWNFKWTFSLFMPLKSSSMWMWSVSISKTKTSFDQIGNSYHRWAAQIDIKETHDFSRSTNSFDPHRHHRRPSFSPLSVIRESVNQSSLFKSVPESVHLFSYFLSHVICILTSTVQAAVMLTALFILLIFQKNT